MIHLVPGLFTELLQTYRQFKESMDEPNDIIVLML